MPAYHHQPGRAASGAAASLIHRIARVRASRLDARMMSTSFLAGLVVLLIVPGPTNTLLAAAGATAGLRSAMQLLAAEMLAYLVAVALLGFALAPLVMQVPRLGVALQAVAALYLLQAAWRLWRTDTGATTCPVVSWRLVFLTTLMNPKSLVIAFGLMPAGWNSGIATALPHLLVLASIIPAMGGLWLLAGRLGGRAMGPAAARRAPRLSALALTVFAILLARAAWAG